jgi:hypothetical protein
MFASFLMMFVLIYLRDDLPLGFESAWFLALRCFVGIDGVGQLKPRYLRYFVTVAELQSFTQPAQHLGRFHPCVIPTLERTMMPSPRNCTGDNNLPFTAKSKNTADAG